MRQGHAGEYELLNTLFANDDLNIGYYKEEDTKIDKARELMLLRILRLVPKIAKKTKFLVVGAGWGTAAMTIVDTYLCRVDSISTTKKEQDHLEKALKKKEYEKKLYTHLSERHVDLPTETDNYNVLLSQEVMSYVEDKRKLFIVYHASLMAEGRLVMTDFLQGEKYESKHSDLFGHSDAIPLWTDLDVEKLTNKSGLQKVYNKDFSPELIGHYQYIIKELDIKKATVDKKLGKGASQKHTDIYKAKIEALEKGAIKWCLYVYQKINI